MARGSDSEKTQAVTGARSQESPTEVVGGQRATGGPAYRSDATIVHHARQPQPSFAWLVVVKGRRLGEILHVNMGETVIGRDPECEILLDDEYCSRRHAKIKSEPDPDAEGAQAFFIYDLATVNHTYVNDNEILKEKLVDGSRVQIGDTIMVFKRV